MGGLARKMQRASGRKKRENTGELLTPSKPEILTPTLGGVFCDCYGTLYSHSFAKNDLLVRYLNARLAQGDDVTLISTNPAQVLPHIRDIGLHEEIVTSLMPKNHLRAAVLEEWIDDDPVLLRAAVQWSPNDPKFVRHMQDFLAQPNGAAFNAPALSVL